ncbi:hypothetical protein ACQJ5C_04330 [Helicobacter pylori]
METKSTLSNHYRDGTNYSVSNLKGIVLPQTSLKHKNRNELNNKKEKINMINTRTHENFSQVKETNRF